MEQSESPIDLAIEILKLCKIYGTKEIRGWITDNTGELNRTRLVINCVSKAFDVSKKRLTSNCNEQRKKSTTIEAIAVCCQLIKEYNPEIEYNAVDLCKIINFTDPHNLSKYMKTYDLSCLNDKVPASRDILNKANMARSRINEMLAKQYQNTE